MLAELGERSDTEGVRDWLSGLGVDPTAPLWLAEGIDPGPERPQIAFPAYRWMRTYQVVATDRALHLFHRGPVRAVRERILTDLSGPDVLLQPRMRAVMEGDFTDRETGLDLSDVVRATFSPMIGGHWWRLRLHTAEQRLVIRGDGPERDLEAELAALLGERLRTRWLHTHRWLFAVRNVLGFACLGFGGVGLVTGVFFLVHPATDLTRADCGLLTALSLAVVAVGFVPDLLAAGLQRLRR